MTAARLRAILAHLHWTQRGLAEILGCAPTLVQRWARADNEIAPIVADWLERRAASAAEHPVPTDWRRPRGGDRTG